MKFLFALITIAALTPACDSKLNSFGADKELVLDRDFADPAILKAKDGTYYAYATQSPDPAKGVINLQVASSKDLKSWRYLGEGLPAKPTWASKTQNIWAPHVSFHDGKYILYYSADPNTLTGLCLAVAVADRPEGPFEDVGQPLLCGKGFVNIDPMQFDDPKTGQPYLIWGSGFEPLKIQKLAANRLEFEPDSQPVDLIWPVPDTNPDNYQRLVEGAWLVENEGWYYLFFSGDNCCDLRPHYGVMVARSRSVMGPYKNFEGGLGLHRNVVVAEDATWSAPGHNAVIKDEQGQSWVFYHGIDRKNPYMSENSRAVRRPLLRSRLTFKNGWPDF